MSSGSPGSMGRPIFFLLCGCAVWVCCVRVCLLDPLPPDRPTTSRLFSLSRPHFRSFLSLWESHRVFFFSLSLCGVSHDSPRTPNVHT